MIIVTGAGGFIGSCMVSYLNSKGIRNLGLVDDFSSQQKSKNISDKQFLNIIDRNEFIQWFDLQHDSIDFVIHLGARTDTTEFNTQIFDELNLNYSKEVWRRCTEYKIPLIYASSGATYGDGELGYDDDHALIPKLKPLNPYGQSKQDFDEWILTETATPPQWQGLKFFNVYGPNENHKGRMASVVFHGFNQAQKTGVVKLFRSHRPDYKDGMQLRDFIYVKDIVKVISWLMENKAPNAIYNLGTGKAKSFIDLVNSTFTALNKEPRIEWIDIPEDIRDKYQYFTEAKMGKLRNAGYKDEFISLEAGVMDYVTNYLVPGKYY